MTTEPPDIEFYRAMVTLAQWRSANRDSKEVKEEPQHVVAARSLVMLRLSQLREGDQDPWMGRKINVLIRKSTRYIVYLDDEVDVQWWWTDRLSSEEGLSVIQANVTRLTCASDFLLRGDIDDLSALGPMWRILKKTFRKPTVEPGLAPGRQDAHEKINDRLKTAIGVRSLIAESMALVLNGVRRAECEAVQTMAEHQIEIEKDKMCRTYFFWQFCLAVGALTIMNEGLRFSGLLEKAGTIHVVTAALCGAFGAFVSALTRTRQLALEPESGRRGLQTEAFARAAIGAGAGILVHFAFDSNVLVKAALSADGEIRNAAQYFLCISAGASERILPSLLGRAESLVHGRDSTGESIQPNPEPSEFQAKSDRA